MTTLERLTAAAVLLVMGIVLFLVFTYKPGQH